MYVVVLDATDASMVCFDKLKDGVLWKSQQDEAAYSSLMVATLGGVNQVVYFAADSLMGIQASDGRLLWREPLKTTAKRHAATPVIRGDSVMVNSHTIGLVSFKIRPEGSGLSAMEGWLDRELKINLSTPVLAGDFL